MQFLKRSFPKKRVVILFISILILGSLLRFYGLDKQSLSNDELASWARAHYSNLSKLVNVSAHADIHPPGYYILLYFVEKYIGDSELILRFPSAIAGVLAIFVIFLLGCRLYSYKEGLIASALMAVLWCPIYYSQEARPYSILILLASLATYFWISILENLKEKVKPSYFTILGYIITAIIFSYLHYFGLYLIVLQGLGAVLFFIRRRRALVYILSIYLLIILAYLPWLPAMWRQFFSPVTRQMGSWIPQPRTNIFNYYFQYLEFLFNNSRVPFYRHGHLVEPYSRPLLSIVLVLYLFLLVHSLYNIWRTKGCKNRKKMLFSPSFLLILWLIVPFTFIYIESKVGVPLLTFRNLIISLPAAYLLLSRSITQLPLRSRSRAVVASVIVGLFLSHLQYYSKPFKYQFREAVYFIAERDHLYENSLIIGYAWNPAYFNFYFKKKGSVRRVNVMGGSRKDIPRIDKVIRRENPRYIWYIYALRRPNPKFIAFLNKNLTLIEHKKFLGAGVLLFENKLEITNSK